MRDLHGAHASRTVLSAEEVPVPRPRPPPEYFTFPRHQIRHQLTFRTFACRSFQRAKAKTTVSAFSGIDNHRPKRLAVGQCRQAQLLSLMEPEQVAKQMKSFQVASAGPHGSLWIGLDQRERANRCWRRAEAAMSSQSQINLGSQREPARRLCPVNTTCALSRRLHLTYAVRTRARRLLPSRS